MANLYKKKVYFTKEISPEALIKLYKAVEKKLPGKIAVKIHTGEHGNQNYIHPDFFKPICDYLNTDTVVECNTAYEGARNYTDKHLKLLEEHEWTKYFNVDILDANGDISLPIEDGNRLEENFIGKNLINYDSLLVLSHFKGHPCGGFGGALKQLSIGCASTKGKCLIHSDGKVSTQDIIWENMCPNSIFCECMADAAKSVVDVFGDKAVYISAMINLSVDCDCCEKAEDPCMKDIGILASTDPVALDKACIDLIWKSDDPGRDHFVKRVEDMKGRHTIEAAERIGIGSTKYELIEI